MTSTPKIKSHRLEEWIKKENQTVYCIQEAHLIQINIHRLNIKGWKTIFPTPGP